ncbi:hypothetical protein JKP88DRAFT_202156 [Tribonema minus]|uniref:Uncharacterized protein n=1 Tax=Tribonema minus TaxID=303371 RepID=A0A836CAF1_9STRA|nr:hypothetical protein JKP88DRAFT_202156 [Tribonema minus]
MRTCSCVAVVTTLCARHASAFIQPVALRHTSLQPAAVHSRRTAPATALSMGIKAVRDYDSSFTLSEECTALLTAYLQHPDMAKEVCKQFDLTSAEYVDGEIFQPVPYSPNTPHGMPLAFERYLNHDDYVIANVPPVVMFKAKIFKPSRLCAVFRVAGRSAAAVAALREAREHAQNNAVPRGAADQSEGSAGAGQSDSGEVWEGLGDVIRASFEEGDGDYDDDDELDALVL